jgi:hypothetical protein
MMHLIDVLVKKTKGSQILSISFLLFSCFQFIPQCYFLIFTLNLGKKKKEKKKKRRRERGREFSIVVSELKNILPFFFF